MFKRMISLLFLSAVVFAACSSAGGSPAASAGASSAGRASSGVAASAVAGGLLDKVLKAKTLVVSTDPNYSPQSFLKSDGTFEGFDIDVATEIAKRLGVGVKFETPGWDTITAGSWGGRWDASVGSMTITVPRQAVLDFSPPVLLHPRPDGRHDRVRDHHPRRPCRQDGLRRVGDDLPGLARGQAAERVARPGGDAAESGSRSRRSTPTRPAPRRSPPGGRTPRPC